MRVETCDKFGRCATPAWRAIAATAGPAAEFSARQVRRSAELAQVTSRTRRALLASIALVWGGLAAMGVWAMVAYQTTPGAVADTPERWPSASRLPRGAGYTVVMFVHPDCPCSRASLSELAENAGAGPAAGSAVAIDVVVAGPDVAGEIWDAAGRIPGATRIVDTGREAERFGARTSGHTVVYDAGGVRRFSGGITGSRGHVGDNLGRDAVQRIVAGLAAQSGAHPVFGCALGGGG